MTTEAPARADPTTAYARSVVDGEVVTSRLVKLACQRHLDDLVHGEERGLRFDPEAAQRPIDFFSYLQLGEGEHAGQPFILQPWQEFIAGCLFGWIDTNDNFRRFRTAYIEGAKGCGKSPFAAGLGLFMLTAAGEVGAEVYCAAVTYDQARISFRDARLMAEASAALRNRLRVQEYNIAFEDTNSFMRAVSAEHRGLDGKRVFCAIVDEIHEHPNALVTDKISAGTKGRRSPLIIEITNSGYNRETVCYQHHELSRKVLEGTIENDSWFAFVCGLDPCESCRAAGHSMPQDGCPNCDDWRDEAVWPKANPNIGISITLKYLRQQVAEAIGMPSKQNIVQRLNFCIWTQSVQKWLDATDWEQCSAAPVEAGRRWIGYDLSTTTDITALVRLYEPDPEGFIDVVCDFFMPEENLRERGERDGVPYEMWARQGFITTTPGNTVDYEFVRKRVNDLGESGEVVEVAGDPWNATSIQTALMGDGFEVVPIVQGYAQLTAPCKELEKLVRSHKLRHGGNPVLRWMAANTVIELDAQGNMKITKGKSTGRIDGIAALLCALSRLLRWENNDEFVGFTWV